MEEHGFVVLTETGAIREAYLEFMQLLKEIFGGDDGRKESCKGGVHFNERGIPMVRKAQVESRRLRPTSLGSWPRDIFLSFVKQTSSARR